jgi:hypothetical protein
VDGEASSRCGTDHFQSEEWRFLFFINVSIIGKHQTDGARITGKGQARAERPTVYEYFISILVDLLRQRRRSVGAEAGESATQVNTKRPTNKAQISDDLCEHLELSDGILSYDNLPRPPKMNMIEL